VNFQELIGEEAPSRARKVIRTGDIIISTCRPTRGAIAVVPEELDNQICSTGFSVIRANKGVNTQYLHFILRSESTREQFRKWSTGSSYPAILDEDVLKTLIPLPSKTLQDSIADKSYENTRARNEKIKEANDKWIKNTNTIMQQIIDHSTLV
jgi:type I restriction enzyme S subunit